jgi:uncharacterized protein involved in response to NO
LLFAEIPIFDEDQIKQGGPCQAALVARMQLTTPSLVPDRRSLTWRELTAEPFRIFFPLGLLLGVGGVLLWPLHFSGIWPAYPGTAHARLMAHGFFGSFVLGFLGTALPRMLGTRPFSSLLVTSLWLTQIGAMGLHAAGFTVAADGTFLAVLLLLGGAVVARFRERSELPPPGFVLAALGLLCAVTGLVAGFWPLDEAANAIQAVVPARLMYQGFLILPVLGVGGFIFPGLLGSPERPDFPATRRPTSGWLHAAAWAGAAGGAIMVSFFLEAQGQIRLGHLLRVGAAGLYLGWQIPLRQAAGTRSTAAYSLRAGLGLMLAGLLAVALFPPWRVAWLHLTLASGLVAVTLVVATRVVWGHSGQRQRLQARNVWLIVALALLFSGTLTRITGDFLPQILPTHYSYGALMWAAGAILWAWQVLPAVLVADEAG